MNNKFRLFIKNNWRLYWFPVFVLLLGIIFNIPEYLGNFLSGLGVELVGFAITILFFDLVLLKQHEDRKLKQAEIKSNKKVFNILDGKIKDLQLSIELSMQELIRGDNDFILLDKRDDMDYDMELTPDLTKNIFQKATMISVAVPHREQRAYHQILQSYQQMIEELRFLLPLVHSHTDKGEEFQNSLLKVVNRRKDVLELFTILNAFARMVDESPESLDTNESKIHVCIELLQGLLVKDINELKSLEFMIQK